MSPYKHPEEKGEKGQSIKWRIQKELSKEQ